MANPKTTRADAASVSLREINADTVRTIVDLVVAEHQRDLVAPNAVSLAQALFSPEAWYRAIYRGDEPVGFVMLYDESLRADPPEKPEVSVWRLMVDARFQRQGIGRAALLLVLDHVRAKGLFDHLELSYVPVAHGPEQFYRGLGFQPTGRVDGGEVEMTIALR